MPLKKSSFGLTDVAIRLADGRRHYNLTNAPNVGSQSQATEGRSEERSPNGIAPDEMYIAGMEAIAMWK